MIKINVDSYDIVDGLNRKMNPITLAILRQVGNKWYVCDARIVNLKTNKSIEIPSAIQQKLLEWDKYIADSQKDQMKPFMFTLE